MALALLDLCQVVFCVAVEMSRLSLPTTMAPPSLANPFYANYVPMVHDFYLFGKEMMNRAGRRLGKIPIGGPENHRFCSFFGASVTVVLEGWYMMKGLELIPIGGLVVHYLWALMFMKL